MRTFKLCMIILWLNIFSQVRGQLPLVFSSKRTMQVRSISSISRHLTAERIGWMSDQSGKRVQNAENVSTPGVGQANLNRGEYLALVSDSISLGGILLDFGHEVQGGIKFITTMYNANPDERIRIRFGESVSEAMSDIGKNGAINDHTMHDFTVSLPWLWRLEVGNSGLRFVRIDLVDPDSKIKIKEISALFTYRGLPYLGPFTYNDERLNQIWMTGATTLWEDFDIDWMKNAARIDELVPEGKVDVHASYGNYYYKRHG